MAGGPWDAYWREYEALRAILPPAAVGDLDDAKGPVNGLTDGWADHLAALRRARGLHPLTPDQARAWRRLEAAVEKALRRR